MGTSAHIPLAKACPMTEPEFQEQGDTQLPYRETAKSHEGGVDIGTSKSVCAGLTWSLKTLADRHPQKCSHPLFHALCPLLPPERPLPLSVSLA